MHCSMRQHISNNKALTKDSGNEDSIGDKRQHRTEYDIIGLG